MQKPVIPIRSAFTPLSDCRAATAARHVGHDLRICPARHQADRLRELPVAHGLAAFAVVEVRRHGLVALGRDPLRDFTDVVVQAERLLDDDDGG